MKPYLTVEWNDTKSNAQGWLVVSNFVKGNTGGGTRMHPTVTKNEVHRLAEAMSYKYEASTKSTTLGGCKAGIRYDYKAPDAPKVLERFLVAMMPYVKYGVSIGSDLGTNYNYILSIFNKHGVMIPQAKWMQKDPKIQQGIKNYDKVLKEHYDIFEVNDAVTGYGTAYCADEAWKFKGGKKGAKVVIQGFGCVGASCAYIMEKMGYKVVGISDANTMVECQDGLDTEYLFKHRKSFGEMNEEFFKPEYKVRANTEWLDVECDILVPAALEDVINKDNAHKVKASLISEGANIPVTAEGDEILKAKGVEVVNDFVANLGAIRSYDAVIFGMIEPTAEAMIKDVEKVCRENTRKLFEESKKQGRYQRDVAKEMFEPKIQDLPDVVD
jgi:glutamate dehydrogenase (NAD(P)+)